jgi:hypothetical protein
MTFKIEAPLITPNQLNGIIYKLKNELKVDPINDNYVIPSSINAAHNNLNTLVNWDAEYSSHGPGSSTNQPWVQLSFPNRYIFPTAYSIRGSSSGSWFSTEWYVYGIQEGDENAENRWDLLSTNKNTESIYCITVGSNGECYDLRVGTFNIQNISTKGYRHLRWRQKTSCCGGYYFSTTGIDVYGTLSSSPTLSPSPTQKIKKNQCSCYCNIMIYRLIISALLVNMINKE